MFTVLCKELKEAFAPHGLLLTAAVGMGIPTIDKAYEISEIVKYLDFINLMSYDLHGSWENFVGHNAPLYKRADEVDEQAELNVDYAVRYWIENGAPPGMLVLGLATYGRAFKLTNASKYLPGSAAGDKGIEGKWTREPGFLSYYEICEHIQKNGWKIKWDAEAMTPYAHKGKNWVGFDNEQSLEIKVNYAKEKGLGGIMFWVFDFDFRDFQLILFK